MNSLIFLFGFNYGYKPQIYIRLILIIRTVRQRNEDSLFESSSECFIYIPWMIRSSEDHNDFVTTVNMCFKDDKY